jgi:hypothetical protein
MNELVPITVPVLEWLQPKTFVQRFELHASGRISATLAFPKGLGTPGRAETPDGVWTITRSGFFRVYDTLRREGKDDDEAVFTTKFSGKGVLRFADGAEYTWTSRNFRETRWAFTDGDHTPVMTLQQGVEGATLRDALKSQITVNVEPGMIRHTRAPLLASLGMYLRVMMLRKSLFT